MGILMWIVFGFVVGLIARAILPGDQKMGIIKTTLLGVGGSFAGGAVATLVNGGQFGGMDPAGFVGSVIGAVALMTIAAMLKRRAST